MEADSSCVFECRRLARLTNAFREKLENFQAAVALNFAYFCKRRMTVKTTPAVAALQNWLRPVANTQDYIAALRAAIKKVHNCWSQHIYTAHVKEMFQGKTVWEGDC